MVHEWLEREDLSVFVVSGVPKNFNRRLQSFIEKEHGESAHSLRVKEDLAPWVLAQVRGSYRPSSSSNLASRALWRAYRALAAARFHLREDKDRDKALKQLRDEVETHWAAVSPRTDAAAD